MQAKIPFDKPFLTGKEIEYIAQALAAGQIAADGAFTQHCAQLLEARFGIRKVLITPSCTAALELAVMLCDLQPGDEAIMPSFTFVSTANAVMRAGARPVFVDIRPDTLNLDEELIERVITPRTKAIFPVHYAGVACAMERLEAIAESHHLKIIEDAAQGVNAFYHGRALGTLGHLGAYSFHHTKNYVCGEGGALCINAEAMIDRAEIIREKGTNRSQFFRGVVDKYTWVDIGSSYLPNEMACAFLLAQLEAMDEITARRRQVYKFYQHHLAPLAEREWLQLPVTPLGCESNYHLFHILLTDEKTRAALMAYLKGQGISAVFHYVPLHTSPQGLKLGYNAGDLPLTEDLSGRLLRLPFFCEITEAEQMRVVLQIAQFFERAEVAK